MDRSSGGPVLVVDLGGTKISVALMDSVYTVLAREKYPTEAGGGPVAVIGRLFHAMDHILEQGCVSAGSLSGICIAAAGFIDMASGVITGSPNLPGWSDIPLRDRVQARYGARTYLINDARAAALGEHRLGAGTGTANMVLLTLGTGIGGGIIMGNKLYFGTLGTAGEIGHMSIDRNGPECPCGNHGCLEVLASGTAIAREARQRLVAGEKSGLMDMVHGNLELITAENVAVAARAGDRLSSDVIGWAGANLGVGLVNLVNIFNPEMIVLGGSVANMGELIIGPAGSVVEKRAIAIAARRVRIVTARLGNDAGIFGAAIFAFEGGVWR